MEVVYNSRTHGNTLRLLCNLLDQGHKLGLGVYTNSELIKDTIENQFGLPCTLIKPEPLTNRKTKAETIDTRFLILDNAGKFATESQVESKIYKMEKYSPQYWDLYNTREKKFVANEHGTYQEKEIR